MLQIRSASQSDVHFFDTLGTIPYLLFFFIAVLVNLFSRSIVTSLTLSISSFLMFICTILFYGDLSSSTAGLNFLFGPLYLSIGIPIFIGLSYLVIKLIIIFKANNVQ
jgi:hypothetical protein